MDPMIQQWIWLETLRTNWRAIQLRLMPASPALSREFAVFAERLRLACSTQQFAAILDDLVDLIAGTEASDYVRGLLVSSTIPETRSTHAVREEARIPLPVVRPRTRMWRCPAGWRHRRPLQAAYVPGRIRDLW